MLTKIRDVIDAQNVKIQKQKFRKKLSQIQRRDFSIISCNCIGSLFYQLLNLPYTTPSVGLYFFPQCYLKFAANLKEYLKEDLVQIHESRYPEGNMKIEKYNHYPLGRLGDIEIHFMHYSNWDEVVRKWNRRKERINFNNLFFIFNDQNMCNYQMLQKFDQLPYSKKVCFTAKKYDLSSCVQIPYYAHNDEVGNLMGNYHLFNNCFNFVSWFNNPESDGSLK